MLDPARKPPTSPFLGRRNLLLGTGATLLAGCARQPLNPLTSNPTDHTAWVGQVFERMQTIHPGITRRQLLTVFTTEGGLSTDTQQTFVSQDCPYFKVDVTFTPVGRPQRDRDRAVTLLYDSRDLIATISRPYLGFSVVD